MRIPIALHYLSADVSDVDSLAAMVDGGTARFGTVDPLVNNAAVFDLAPLLESRRSEYKRIFDVNVKGMFFAMQAVLRAGRRAAERQRDQPRLAGRAARRGAGIALLREQGRGDQLHASGGACDGAARHPRQRDFAGRHRHADVAATWTRSSPATKALHRARRRSRSARPCRSAAWARRRHRRRRRLPRQRRAAYITAQTVNVDGGNVMS